MILNELIKNLEKAIRHIKMHDKDEFMLLNMIEQIKMLLKK
jgi:ribosomal protein S15P/S13E